MLDPARTGTASADRDGVAVFLAASAAFSSATIAASSSAARASSASVRVSGRGAATGGGGCRRLGWPGVRPGAGAVGAVRVGTCCLGIAWPWSGERPPTVDRVDGRGSGARARASGCRRQRIASRPAPSREGPLLDSGRPTRRTHRSTSTRSSSRISARSSPCWWWSFSSCSSPSCCSRGGRAGSTPGWPA